MQATTKPLLPPIRLLLDPIDDSNQISVDPYIKESSTPVDYISAHSNNSRRSPFSSTSSPLSGSPPITPMSSSNMKQDTPSPTSSSFRLPQTLPSLAGSPLNSPTHGTNFSNNMTMSHHNKPAMTLTGLGPHPSNILSLLSPPESPDLASANHYQSPGLDVYQQQSSQHYTAPQPQYNAHPAYTSTVKPAAIYSQASVMQPHHQSRALPGQVNATTTHYNPYHVQSTHHHHHHHHQQQNTAYTAQPIHQQQRYSHTLQPSPVSPYDRRSHVGAPSLPRLDMSTQMLSHQTNNHGKRMPSPKSMDESSSSNANRYQCPFCAKRFSRPSSLRIHTYSHTGEKPFVCTEPGCGRKFSVQSNMRRHLRVHRLGRPVKKVRYDGEVEGVKVMNPGPVLRSC